MFVCTIREKGLPELITEFDESLLCMAPSSHMWAALVESMKEYAKDRIVFRLTCDAELVL